MKVVSTVIQLIPIIADILINTRNLKLQVINRYIKTNAISWVGGYIIIIRKGSNHSQILSPLQLIQSLITIPQLSGILIILSKIKFIANLHTTK